SSLPIFQLLLMAFQLLRRADDAECIVIQLGVANADRADDLERQPPGIVVAQFRRLESDYETIVGDFFELPGADVGLEVERVRAVGEDVAGFAGAVVTPVDVGGASALVDMPAPDEELA